LELFILGDIVDLVVLCGLLTFDNWLSSQLRAAISKWFILGLFPPSGNHELNDSKDFHTYYLI
jgi:hypothetical protein